MSPEPTPEVRQSHHRPAMRRRIRAPWTPTLAGPYRLPASIVDRLSRDLASFRNRDSAMALAVMLARFWSAPSRITLAFPVDRRALAARHPDLGLTEARVRGALATLETIGFLARSPVIGRTHRATPGGGLHRKPTLWRFAPDFLTMFRQAHGASRMTKGGVSRLGRPLAARPRLCPPARPVAASTNSPKHKAPAERAMFMGDHHAIGTVSTESRWEKPSPATPCPALAAALDRLTAARRRAAL